jgi:hypothetical protein
MLLLLIGVVNFSVGRGSLGRQRQGASPVVERCLMMFLLHLHLHLLQLSRLLIWHATLHITLDLSTAAIEVNYRHIARLAVSTCVIWSRRLHCLCLCLWRGETTWVFNVIIQDPSAGWIQVLLNGALLELLFLQLLILLVNAILDSGCDGDFVGIELVAHGLHSLGHHGVVHLVFGEVAVLVVVAHVDIADVVLVDVLKSFLLLNLPSVCYR